jgi:nucleotide-binding universal stress UspA family protein
MTHAFHSSSVSDGGKFVYVGEPAGYIVRLPGGLTVYHAGDTAVFGDMKLIAELYQPEVACLPIGDFYTMSPREAALACRLLNAPKVIPMHFNTFPALTGRPDELTALLKDFPRTTVWPLEIGKPATEIVQCAKDWPADLIVIGSRGRGGVGSMIRVASATEQDTLPTDERSQSEELDLQQGCPTGSVAWGVLRHAHCPVVVVPPQA